MVSISFVYPFYLFFLAVIPLFIFIHIITLKSTKSTSLKFANFDAIAKIKGVDFFSKNIIILILSSLVILFMVMSLAGTTLHLLMESSKYSFVIALDSSHSMGADDIPPNRMAAAKQAAIEFVDATPLTTRIGVVSFSGNAIIESKITDSKVMVKSAISNVQISEIAGTDIEEGIITSTNLLSGEDSRAIIMLSDGQINVGNIDEAISYLNENNIVLHSIAIGTEEGGQTSYGLSKVDEDSLKALSYNTGGQYFKAIDESELDRSFNEAIEKTKQKVAINLSVYLIMIALFLFILEYYLINSRYKRLV